MMLTGPADQTVPVGQGVGFCVNATNDCGGELTYQWRFQGVEIPGATANCYVLATARPTNAGSYDVVVTNLAVAVTSPAAALTVVGALPHCCTVTHWRRRRRASSSRSRVSRALITSSNTRILCRARASGCRS